MDLKNFDPRQWDWQRIKRIALIIAIILVILAVAILFSQPRVVTGIKTAQNYFTGRIQAKAWNAAKAEVLQAQLADTQQTLNKVEPKGFTEIEVAQAAQAAPRPALNIKIEAYLRSKNSPLADYTDLLMQQNNWEKLISVSFAESTFCNRMPAGKFNCWGIGGSNLWDFGNSMADGIVGANTFMNNYPQGSVKKFSQMSIMEMNGKWNQPATSTWSGNNYTVMDELLKILSE